MTFRRHAHIALLATVTFAICIAVLLGHVHSWAATAPTLPISTALGAALAAQQPMVTASTPPDSNALMGLLMQGKYLPLVGGALMLLISALRAGSIALVSTWFKTKLGGYVLGYGGTFAFYLGSAWYSGAPVSGELITMAIAAAILSAGALEHGSDLLKIVKAAPAAATGAAVAMLLIGAGAIGTEQALSGCTPATQQAIKDAGKGAAVAELDCLQPELARTAAKIEPALEAWLRQKLGGGTSTGDGDVGAAVKALPGDAWSCAWATAIAALLSLTPKTTDPATNAQALSSDLTDDTAALRVRCEALRPALGGQHFKTAAGYW
jgi:hypothetical protein